MFSSARQARSPIPQPIDRRLGGPTHIRDVPPDALDRLAATRLGEGSEPLERPAPVRLPGFVRAA